MKLSEHVQSDIAASMAGESSVATQLREAFEDALGWTSVGGNAPATYSGGLQTWGMGISSVRGRDEGRFHPFYETEFDLQKMRAKCRNLATFTSIAVGALQALRVYTMGGDWEYEVVARSGVELADALLAEVQAIVDANLERNEFVACLDNEIHDASVEDGESLVAVYGAPDGLVDIRRLDANNLREPAQKQRLDDWLGVARPSSWSFGVQTIYDERQRRIDHTRHAGYHVVWDDGGAEWDYLPAWPQHHLDSDRNFKFGHLIRRNVTLSAKRGISDYWPVLTDLEREDKLSENTSVGAAILAAIPWIEEMPPGTTRADAQSQVSSALDNFSRNLSARNGGERSVQRFRPGTIPKVSAGRKYHAGPMGAVRSPIYIEVGQSLKRRIGIRWLFPEYMISGDASNANYSSTLVAESPFVKAREGDQQFYIQHFRKILFKALKIAADMGRFARHGVHSWRDLAGAIDLHITPPPVASRDKTALLSELFGMFDRQTIDANELRTALRHEPKEGLDGKTGQGMSAGAGPESNPETQQVARVAESLKGLTFSAMQEGA